MTVAPPGVCIPNSVDVVGKFWTNSSPQAESAIDMHPGPISMGNISYSLQVVECACVDIPRLSHHDRWS
jgi:hypothetical protein